MTTRTRILTGITTTGTPHLGNYAGAIRPAILASQDANADSFYFLADYHALIKCDDLQRIQRSRWKSPRPAGRWPGCEPSDVLPPVRTSRRSPS
jgi:tryptophanyl-tRNA synthetase